MKKKLLVVLSAVISTAVCAFGLSACFLGNRNQGVTTCAHNFEYLYDEEYHQGLCLKCGETTEEKHTFSDYVCTVCGYTKDSGETVNGKTVSFDPDGGKCDVKTKNFTPGELMTGLPTPTKDGYNFICWEDPLGIVFNETSIMPNTTLSLKARWEKVISKYEDKYLMFKPANPEPGCKDPLIKELYKNEVDVFVYVELTSDDLGGVKKVGTENNFNLLTLDGMEYKVMSGYSWKWYLSDFQTPNGAQRFTLNYGSNIQFVAVENSSGVVEQTYLLDIYVKHDYYISLYKNIFEEEPYDKIRVIENEKFPSDTKVFDYENGFEFDKRVYFNNKNGKYEQFPNIAITQNWNLYQTYKPLTMSADLDEGVLNEELLITPYTQSFTLPSPEKKGYDFLGWQLSDGKFITNIEGYSGENYISKENFCDTLKAVYSKKKFYYTFEDDTLQTFKTVPVVTYTDKTCTEILEIVYVPYNTDCVLPVKTAQSESTAFSDWKYYSKNTKGEYIQNPSIYEFNQKITSPVALFPETVSGNTHNTIPLNVEKTYKYQDTYTAYLPVAETYKLSVSTTGSVTFKLSSAQNTYRNSYTATAGNPVSVDVACYAYELGEKKNIRGYVTVTVTSLSGTFTASLNGVTAKTEGKPINLTKDNSITVGNDFTINSGKQDYAFNGWYSGNSLITKDYTFTIPSEEIVYKAKWVKLSLETNDVSAGTVTNLIEKYKVGDEVTVTAETNSGYTFVGWYNGETKLTDNLSYTFAMPAESFMYTAKWIKVTVNRNDISAGTVTNLAEKYRVGDEVTVTAETNSGYTFVGWFNGETKLTDDLSYTFAMPAGSVTYTAKWIKVTVERNNVSAGTVTNLTEKFKTGDEVTVTAETKRGYIFIGWFNGETKLTNDLSYTFTMPAENVAFTAKWEVMSKLHNLYFTSTKDECIVTGVKDKNITELILPDIVTDIGAKAFSNCSSLENITIPDSIISIGDDAFIYCNKLQYNEYDNAYYLGNENNKYLVLVKEKERTITSCTINENTKFIYSYAFKYCRSLTSIIIPNGVTSIGKEAFYNCGLESISIPDSVTSIGSSAFNGCDKLQRYEYGNAYYLGNENNNYLLLVYNKSNTITYCTINENTKIIHNSAFSGCRSLTSITIPDGVTSIGESAFYNCSSLTSVTIPDSIKSIGESAYSFCYKLRNIYYSGNIAGWCGISGLGTIMSNHITLLSIDGKQVTGSITIPDGVTSISDYVFYGCSKITSITVPNSVTNIGRYVFSRCSSLKDINFEGTKAKWYAIEKDSYWNSDIGDYTVHCSDGDLSKSES